MTRPKDFNNESQDARRHDQHQVTHPDNKSGAHHGKTEQKQTKNPQTKHDKK